MVDWSIRLPEHVVVTGSANGLGDECARLLTNAQCRVYGVDVATPPDGLALCGHYVHVVGSVTDPSTWDEVEKHLDLAENIATIGFIGAAAILDVAVLEEEELDSWRRTWEVNVGGNVLALKRLLPRLSSADHGSAVVVSSVDAQFAEQQLAAYASSKGALTAAVRTIALDYARTGINFNVLAPGLMRGGLFERHLASAHDPERFLATREARQPIGRIVGPDEVARAAAFLLSDHASAIFGTTLTADGGLTAGFDFRTGHEGSSA